MNVPNILTIFRIILIPIYLLVFFQSGPFNIILSAIILLLSGMTDILDGYLARKTKNVTELGQILDPLADKLMILAVILSFLFFNKIDKTGALLIIFRDILMILFSVFVKYKGMKTVPSNVLGKFSTVFFYLVLFCMMVDFSYADFLLWVSIPISYFAMFWYIKEFLLFNRKNKEDSISN